MFLARACNVLGLCTIHAFLNRVSNMTVRVTEYLSAVGVSGSSTGGHTSRMATLAQTNCILCEEGVGPHKNTTTIRNMTLVQYVIYLR